MAPYSNARLIAQLIGLTTLLTWCGGAPGMANETGIEKSKAEVFATGSGAKIIEKVAPRYPKRARSEWVEGWVIVSYVVNVDGTTSEVQVVEASIDGYFEEAAVSAVTAWRYEPATWNGLPTRAADLRGRLVFAFENTKGGVTKQFHALHMSAIRALEERKFEWVREYIDELDELRHRRLAELFHLDILKGRYWLSQGDYPKSLEHFERALVPGASLTETDLGAYTAILKQAIKLCALQQKYAKALEYYDELESLGALSSTDATHEVVEQINQLIEADSAIWHEATIDRKYCPTCPDSDFAWEHQLFRNRFTINNVHGNIDEIKIKCSRQYVSLAYTSETAFSVDRGWGDCFVEVFGDRGTAFEFLELPN